jgi:hypothetical protein
MRAKEFSKLLRETTSTSISAPELDGMKELISRKIKELPDDSDTAKALKQIEDLLSHVAHGGRYGSISKEILAVQDRAVDDAKKVLSRLVLSIMEELGSTPEQRVEFFELWRGDQLVNIESLLSNKQVNFDAAFNGYSENPIVKEFVDEVMLIQELGMGRGEFGLNVLSRSITVAGKKSKEDNDEDGGSKKGDLQISYDGTKYQVELKTEMGGAARFGDQQVRPAEGFEAAAVTLNSYVKSHKMYRNLSRKISGSGVNLNQAIEFASYLQGADVNKFLGLVRRCVTLIFGGGGSGRKEYSARLKKNIDVIMSSIETGDNGAAAQQWSQASFNFYMSKKHDDGVLYLNLNSKTFLYYQNAEQLLSQGLRFHASTPYISATKDPVRAVYPQIGVQQTTFGGDAAQQGIKKIAKGKNPLANPEFNSNLSNWVMTLADRRGVKNQKVRSQISIATMKMIAASTPTEEIIPRLEAQFPLLKPKLAAPTPVKPPTPVAQPAAVAPAPAVAQPAAPV